MANVLIVDDEEAVRRTTAHLLKNAGHDVRTASDVPGALAEMSRAEVDVVLSDIRMDGDDGICLLRRIRDRSPLTQVVLFTANASLETATEALRLGAFDYLSKPVRTDALCRVVSRAAGEKSSRQKSDLLNEENRRHRDALQSLVTERERELERSVGLREVALERLNGVLESTAQALSMALEMRDPYTAGHQRRVTILACAIWNRMDLSREGRDGLRIAGLLHDLGKIRVPSDILSKPSRLSNAEFALIREHPVSAWEVLRLLDFPWPVADFVRQHHERLDGSGYPDGLKGDSIRREARILGVADVVEAMASHRPYRPALGVDAALAEIQRGRGTSYDPDVVDACVQVFAEDGFQLPA